MITPDRYLVGGSPPAVIVPARIARVLDRVALDRYRREVRGMDAELDAVLAAVHQAGLQWAQKESCSPAGTSEYRSEEAMPESTYDLDTATVARRLGITPRAVRGLHARGRIDGHKVAGRLLFAPERLAAYLTERKDLT